MSVDPIYAYFNVDERSVLKYEEQVRQGKLADARSGAVPISLQLENEQGFPHEGSIDFINNQFNSSTGTLAGAWSFREREWSSDSRIIRADPGGWKSAALGSAGE